MVGSHKEVENSKASERNSILRALFSEIRSDNECVSYLFRSARSRCSCCLLRTQWNKKSLEWRSISNAVCLSVSLSYDLRSMKMPFFIFQIVFFRYQYGIQNCHRMSSMRKWVLGGDSRSFVCLGSSSAQPRPSKEMLRHEVGLHKYIRT